MGFKDYAAADIAVFVNVDEMADSHDIDGQQIPAIVDSNLLSDAIRVMRWYQFRRDTCFARSSELPPRPAKKSAYSEPSR